MVIWLKLPPRHYRYHILYVMPQLSHVTTVIVYCMSLLLGHVITITTPCHSERICHVITVIRCHYSYCVCQFIYCVSLQLSHVLEFTAHLQILHMTCQYNYQMSLGLLNMSLQLSHDIIVIKRHVSIAYVIAVISYEAKMTSLLQLQRISCLYRLHVSLQLVHVSLQLSHVKTFF